MKTKTILGLVIGAALFLAALLFSPDSLSTAGRINLAIFLLAATFWVLEPIPIYATSVVTILLLILTLSAQGPLAMWSQPALVAPAAVASDEGRWSVPESAVLERDGEEKVFVRDGTGFRAVPVEVAQRGEGLATVVSSALTAEREIARRATNWQVEFSPRGYASYLHTLASPIIILFLGGFMLAAAAVKHELDSNLCRFLLKPFGKKPGMVILGLMAVTALLSGFMSNTATTAMMIAVILPIVHCTAPEDRFRVALALCIPFAANVGGILTPIGTPPNAIALNGLAAQGITIPFANWMMFTAPLVIVMLLFIWVLLTRLYPCDLKELPLKLTGKFSRSPKAIVLYVVFGMTVLLWVTESLHELPSGMIAFLPIALLPAFSVVERDDIRSLPWEVLWLMAGGIALGGAMDSTGLALWIVELVPWGNLGALGILAAFGAVAILLATFIANTVAATLLIPIMISLVTSGVVEGFALETAALTVALGASLGMSLPISTPPNAIAMSTGMISTGQMARAGAVIGVAGYGCLLVASFFFWNLVF